MNIYRLISSALVVTSTLVCLHCSYSGLSSIKKAAEFLFNPRITVKRYSYTDTLRNIQDVSVAIPLAKGLPQKSSPGIPLPKTTYLSISKRGYTIEGLTSMIIDRNSPLITLMVTNNAETDLRNTVIAFLHKNDVIFIRNVPYIAAESSEEVIASIAGKKLYSPIALAVCTAVQSGTMLRPEDRLEVSFSLNGQAGVVTKDRAVLQDEPIVLSDNSAAGMW